MSGSNKTHTGFLGSSLPLGAVHRQLLPGCVSQKWEAGCWLAENTSFFSISVILHSSAVFTEKSSWTQSYFPSFRWLLHFHFHFRNLKRHWLNTYCTFFYLVLCSLLQLSVSFLFFSWLPLGLMSRMAALVIFPLFLSTCSVQCPARTRTAPHWWICLLYLLGLCARCLIPQRVAAEIYVCAQPTQVFKAVPREPAGCFTLCK